MPDKRQISNPKEEAGRLSGGVVVDDEYREMPSLWYHNFLL